MHHNVNLYSSDVIIYRPIQKDKCVKCEVYKNLPTKTDTDEINQKDHETVAEYMMSRMSNAEKTCASRECLEIKVGPRKPNQSPEAYEKSLLKAISETSTDKKDKTASTSSKKQSNSNERPDSNLRKSGGIGGRAKNRPSKTTVRDTNEQAENNLNENTTENNKEKASEASNDQSKPEICKDDNVAHIATYMMQIQNLPKCQVGMSYYKCKVSNELIFPNKLNIFIVSNALIMT